MKFHRYFLLGFVFILFGLLSSAALAGQTTPDQAILNLSPASGIYRPGDRLTIAVSLADVSDLYAVDIQLAFDPALFAVVDANPAQPGIQLTPHNDLLWPDLIIKRDADNSAGTIWYAATHLNPRPPATGSGKLFSFEIEALAAGNSAITFTNDQLTTRDAELIPVTSSDGQFRIKALADTYTISLPIQWFNH